MSFSNPIGKGLTPERVDMGVDFGGSGPLYALGDGVITAVYPLGGGSGWPGGGWVGLKLGDGREMYYAEDVSPLVHAGQVVKAGQHIANATGGSSGIEVGWASGQGTSTEAAATGEDKLGLSHGDPGAYPTAFGVDMANLIHSLGGPMGKISGVIQGTLPKNWQAAPSSGSGSGSGSNASLFGSILGLPSQVTDFFTAADDFIKAAMWLVNPTHWVRIGAFFGGTILLLLGLYLLAKMNGFSLPSAPPIPVPVPVL